MTDNFSKNTQENQPIKVEFCPHLGLKKDPLTFLNYPSEWNYCHHVRPKHPPQIEHQRTKCLSETYQDCLVFNSPPNKRMPIKFRDRRKIKPSVVFKSISIFVIVAFIALIFILFSHQSQIRAELSNLIIPAWQKTQQAAGPIFLPTVTTTNTPTTTATPTSTPTPTMVPSITPEPTRRPRVLRLDSPIGGDIKFIIHRVIEGETLGIFASQYNTTESVIRSVNYNLSSVLLIDQILIIPIDVSVATGLPAFVGMLVEDSQITIETFAEQVSADPEEMRYYNDLNEGYILKQGDWVLVPREDFQP